MPDEGKKVRNKKEYDNGTETSKIYKKKIQNHSPGSIKKHTDKMSENNP